MRIVLNGQPREIAAHATLQDVVVAMGRDPHRPGVAVAVDGEVVTRSEWAATPLDDDAVVEVVAAVQGG